MLEKKISHDDRSKMDEKKDAAIDDVVESSSDAEAAEQNAAIALEQEEAASTADGSDVAAEQEQAAENAETVVEAVEQVEDAEQAEAAEQVEDVEQAETVEQAEGVESEIAAEDVVPEESADAAEPENSVDSAATDETTAPVTPAPLKEEKPKQKRPTGSGIGDLVIVGIFSIILGVLLALPSFLGATGGSAESTQTSSAGVAATVNGIAIGEDEVTKYIMDFRTQQGIEDDSAWGEWMVMYGYSPESLRSDTIEFFVNRELLKQAIAEEGIEVAESEVDDYIAMITEQVGGQAAFEQALEAEGITLESYRENILFSLQQQALAKKVAPASEVDDAQVLELVKMYFPDQVDENADSLEGVDESTIEEIRSMLASSAMQQAFDEWMQAYRGKANVVIMDMPESLPYKIDLAPYQAQEDSSDGSGEAETPEVELAETSDGSASAESQDK